MRVMSIARRSLLLAVVVVLVLGLWAGLGQARTQGPVLFNPKTYKGKTGKITVPYRGESTLYTETGDVRKGRTFARFDTKNGTFVVPAGKHHLSVCYAYVKSGSRIMWSARSMPKPSNVTVQPGKTVSLNIGPPFTASIAVLQRGKTVNMLLRFTGRSGEDAAIQRHAGNQKAPGFEVLSTKDTVLMKGTFEYG